MEYLSSTEEKKALEFINEAAKIALKSSCFRAKCGTVIVKNDKIIGQGFNGPPQDKVLDHCLKDNLPSNFKSDKTCCVHAEQRAIIDALKNNPEEIIGSRLYFIRLDKNGNPERAGKPFCTICSKMALDTGIAEFVLWHNAGICVYNTEEYNTLSFQFRE
jgi:deoxycytidylate deaminase